MAYNHTAIIPVALTLTDLADTIRQHGSQFGLRFTTARNGSDVRTLSKRAAKAAGFDPTDLTLLTEYVNFRTYHISYENDVREALKAAGQDPDSYDFDSCKGMEWVPGFSRIFLQKISDPEVKYLRAYKAKTSTTRRAWLVGGKVADPATEAQIESLETNATTGDCAKQLAAGVPLDKIVKPRSFGLDSIVGLSFGKALPLIGKSFDDLLTELA